MGEFWRGVASQPTSDRYLHASVPLASAPQPGDDGWERLVRTELRGLRTWTAPPRNPATDENEAGEGSESTWQVWLGGGGVMSALHYDQTHNIFAQIHGTKRVLLSPPSAIRRAAIFPRVHACHRHSVLDTIGWPSPPCVPVLPTLLQAMAGSLCRLCRACASQGDEGDPTTAGAGADGGV